MLTFKTTGYYYGTTLFLVFLVTPGLFLHCSHYGYFKSDKPYPDGWEEYFR